MVSAPVNNTLEVAYTFGNIPVTRLCLFPHRDHGRQKKQQNHEHKAEGSADNAGHFCALSAHHLSSTLLAETTLGFMELKKVKIIFR